jgi:DNA-binding IclR family transcriptional regulator
MTKSITDDNEVRTIAAVERAFALLEAFNDGIDTMTLAQLADRTGLYKSTVLRIVQTLERLGYLGRTHSGAYHIGPAPLRLGRLYQAAVRPEDIIVPVLRQLVDATHESAGFHVRFKDSRLCLYRVDSPDPVRDHFRPGDLLPISKGAGGLILSAFGEDPAPTLDHVRERMLGISRGAIALEMGGVAAPVFNAHGELEGAITLSGLASRYDDDAVERFGTILLDAALRITVALGGDPRRFTKAMATFESASFGNARIRQKLVSA